jgi:hypothetical protein
MIKYFLACLAVILVTHQPYQSNAQEAPAGLQECSGAFALCAASTCKATGRMITIKEKEYPEMICSCPVLKGKALADVNGGTMEGSCARKNKDQVWSLFSYRSFLPQEVNNWSTSPIKSKTRVQECSSELNLGTKSVNCFSMSCNITGEQNGTTIASCICPMGEAVNGDIIKPATSFLIQAGQGDPEYCNKHPVAITPFGD